MRIYELIKYIIIFLIAFVFFYLYTWFRGMRKKTQRPEKDDMPANLWFYDQLINMEIMPKKATAKRLYQNFMQYLHRKYHINPKDSVFEVVASKEKDPAFIELYGDIYNRTQEMKHSKPSEVLEYIKSIKHVFNQDNVSEWIARRQRDKDDCNDC